MTGKKKSIVRRLLKISAWIILVPLFLIIVILTIFSLNQNAFIQDALIMADEQIHGEIVVKDSYISLFKSFPNVHVDFEDFRIYQDKDASERPIVQIDHLLASFDIEELISGNYKINDLELLGGSIWLDEDTLGNLNLLKAFDTGDTTTTSSDTSSFSLDLEKIRLKNIFIEDDDEEDKIKIVGKIEDITAHFDENKHGMDTKIDGPLRLTLIDGKDTTFLRNKELILDASVRYATDHNLLTVYDSRILFDNLQFESKGNVLMGDEVFVDLECISERTGIKLVEALLPADLKDHLKRYTADGTLYFDAFVKGIVSNGKQPAIAAKFGCKDGYFKNDSTGRKLEKVDFTGYFTNGKMRNITTCEVGILDVYALPEQGQVVGNIVARNFKDPNVVMAVNTKFDLQYLAQFLQIRDLQHLSGQVDLTVKYDELVDLSVPNSGLEKLKQGVDSELRIKNLSFKMPGYPHHIRELNLSAAMVNKRVEISECSGKVGGSDIKLSGNISDLPEFLRFSDKPVTVNLALSSKKLDLKELTTIDTNKRKPIDECLYGFNFNINLTTSAKQFLDSTVKIPTGNFRISSLDTRLKKYNRSLREIGANISVDDNKIVVSDFKGYVDRSDFEMDLTFSNYKMWFSKEMNGISDFYFKWKSDSIRFENIAKYNGVDYMPEDLRDESLKGFYFEGSADVVYDKEFKSAELDIIKAHGKISEHPLRIEEIDGIIKYDPNRIQLNNLIARMGGNDFKIDLDYTYANLPESAKSNKLIFRSNHLDINEVMNFKLHERKRDTAKVVEHHDSAFNVFSIPFSNMKFKLDVNELVYKDLDINKLKGRMRMRKDHTFFIDTLEMDVADGHIDIQGSFNGSDTSRISFDPSIAFSKVNLEKLFLRFDNFGQDYIVSDNISGTLTGTMSGTLRMHADMIPIIEHSEINLNSTVTNGALKNYSPMLAMAEYFKDKNLHNILFDTLVNNFSMSKGILNIPNMNINSTLGYIEIAGTQNITSEKNEMDYQVKVPLHMVTDVGFHYLFGKKKHEMDPGQLDTIAVHDSTRNMKFIHVDITGNADDINVSLGKKKRHHGK